MAEQKRFSRWYLVLIVIALLMFGVGIILGGQPGLLTAEELLPDLPGYNTVEGETLTDYISKLGGGAALLAGQPELALAVAAVDQVIGCYQEVGAVKARVYSNQEAPLSAGIVAIGDRNKLLDPKNLFKCVAPVIPDGEPPLDRIEPCTASYTPERDGNAFYVIYAGTTEEICRAFCAALEGCEKHQ